MHKYYLRLIACNVMEKSIHCPECLPDSNFTDYVLNIRSHKKSNTPEFFYKSAINKLKRKVKK